MLDSSKRGSVLSRSSSPSSFRRAESSSSLNTVGFRSVSHGQDRTPVTPARNSYSGNLRSFAGTVSSINKSLSHMDLRGTLRKPENNSSFPENRGSSSPSRRSYEGPAVRKTETKSPGHDRQSSFSPVGRYDSRTQSPSRWSSDRKTETKSPSYERSPDRQGFSSSSSLKSRYDSRSQSPSRQSYDRKTETKSPSYERGLDRQGFSSSSTLKSRYDSRSKSPMGRMETNGVSSQIQEGRRSASPVRKGYGTLSQSDRRSISNGWSHERKSPSPSRKSYETQSQTTVKKPEPKSYNRESRHSSPSRGHHQNPGTSSLRKSTTSQSLSKRGSESRSPSPLAHSQSPPCKSESGRRPSLSTLRREITDHAPLRNTVSSSASYVRNTNTSQSQHDSSGRWRGSAHSLHSQSVSRNSSPSRHASEKKPASSCMKSAWETPRDGSKRSSMRQNLEAQSSTSDSRRHRSPSPPVQRHTSSQSSMDSESSHLSAGSSGLNREEYAMMADLPKVKTVFQRDGPSHLRKMESRQKRELSRYKPASHSQSKAPSEWDELEDDRDSGTLSRAHSSSSLHTQRASSPTADQTQSSRNPSRASGQNQVQ
ncbi:serine/arginine repetitive matrix protein 2 isoform X2 [Puntigrus tetrazona]|uniref:serine/arginine repetitive matrix protein 2 isoform X2 n=1 Tax=Puntigrus tetrazona TaxID=1606681 RepID=UPI001C8A7BC2|nr:serine/arginine repetitive matrix protein 2 isoform X2 [Puntigrus tetrazona]